MPVAHFINPNKDFSYIVGQKAWSIFQGENTRCKHCIKIHIWEYGGVE